MCLRGDVQPHPRRQNKIGELGVVFELRVVKWLFLCISSLFVTHQLLKQRLQLTDDGLLLFDRVLVQRGLLILLS